LPAPDVVAATGLGKRASRHLLCDHQPPEAVKTAARQVVAVIVVGAANSFNSQRVREVAEREGCGAQFVPAAKDIDWNSLEGAGGLGRAHPRGAWRSATRSRSGR
jgi:hypothetical protein